MQTVSLPIVVYLDDFGNGWGGLYGQVAGLDRNLRNKDENIMMFALMPNNTNTHERIFITTEEMKQLEEGVVMWHAGLQQAVLVVASIYTMIVDMPQANKLASTKAVHSKTPCRKCEQHADKMNEPDISGVTRRTVQEFHSYGERGKKTEGKSKDYKVDELLVNILLKLKDFDPFKDIPVELLHAWFLGIIKKSLSFTIGDLNAKKVARLRDVLRTINLPPNSPAFPDLLKSYKYWQGKHFQTFSQIAIFAFKHVLDADKPEDKKLLDYWLVMHFTSHVVLTLLASAQSRFLLLL